MFAFLVGKGGPENRSWRTVISAECKWMVTSWRHRSCVPKVFDALKFIARRVQIRRVTVVSRLVLFNLFFMWDARKCPLKETKLIVAENLIFPLKQKWHLIAGGKCHSCQVTTWHVCGHVQQKKRYVYTFNFSPSICRSSSHRIVNIRTYTYIEKKANLNPKALSPKLGIFEQLRAELSINIWRWNIICIPFNPSYFFRITYTVLKTLAMFSFRLQSCSHSNFSSFRNICLTCKKINHRPFLKTFPELSLNNQ